MKHVAIITGGISSEREVALRSAKNLERMLDGIFEVSVFDFPEDADRFLKSKDEVDVAIPVMHGKGGEDGEIQGFLETLNIPYIFSGIQAHAIGIDKIKTKLLVSAAGVRCPESIKAGSMPAVYRQPVIVKPSDGGSSVGILVSRSQSELDNAVLEAAKFSNSVMVEDLIEGQEFTVGVIDDGGESAALPVVMISPKEGFFDYASKYDQKSLAHEVCPAPIPEDLALKLQDIALTAHRVLGCRHLSRTDIIVDKNNRAWFLEINTIPGMTETSLVPKAVAAAGKDLKMLFKGWIEDALR